MSEKGRVKQIKNQMSSLLAQLVFYPFDERSEPEKTKFFRVSARSRGQENPKPSNLSSLLPKAKTHPPQRRKNNEYRNKNQNKIRTPNHPQNIPHFPPPHPPNGNRNHSRLQKHHQPCPSPGRYGRRPDHTGQCTVQR